MDKIEEFCDQLITEKGLTTLSDEERAEVRKDMAARINAQVERAAVDALPEDKMKELAEKGDSMTDEQVAQFIRDAGVDVEHIMVVTLMQFRSLYLGNEEQ